VATILLMALNIGLFLLYWHHRVDPTDVALNAQVYQDYGRAISGNLAHFELWHLGFNMMSTSTLGIFLEREIYGSLPLLFYTVSFLALTTLCVLALHQARTRMNHRNHNNNNDHHTTVSLPNMVGFSGILFAWMVVSALEAPRTCPIFFLPDVCFDTYQILGVSVSVGPLVQLLVAQVLLPRVSFTGHLAGILVGFAWHWKLLPPLEWLQPSVLFPILWIFGKGIGRSSSSLAGADSSSCTTGSTSSSSSSIIPAASLLRLVGHTRNVMILHWVFLAHMCLWWNSLVVSEALIIFILSALLRSKNHNNNNNNIGVVGRGLVVLIVVIWVTDSMTLGGWIITRSLLPRPVLSMALLLLFTRWVLWWLVLMQIIYLLEMSHDIPSSGIWHNVLGWVAIVEPSRSSMGSRWMDWMTTTMTRRDDRSSSSSAVAMTANSSVVSNPPHLVAASTSHIV
jgi:membrane associated rhomboid family serine protease